MCKGRSSRWDGKLVEYAAPDDVATGSILSLTRSLKVRWIDLCCSMMEMCKTTVEVVI